MLHVHVTSRPQLNASCEDGVVPDAAPSHATEHADTTCNMAVRPLVQVNVPPASHRTNTNQMSTMSTMSTIPGLSADKALQFTPFTTSILPAVDRIPIPEVSRVRENGRIATSSERKSAQTLCQQQNLQPVIRNQIIALLNRNDSQMY